MTQKQRSRRYKVSLYMTIFTVIVGSAIIIISVFDITWETALNKTPLLGQENSVTDAEKKKVKKVYQTVGVNHQDVGEFIAETHEFYNQTTGYGAINSIDWTEQAKEAEKVMEATKPLLLEVENTSLKKDLQELQAFAEKAPVEQNPEIIKNIHRIVHDLDIALNDYDGYDKIWNVTETLK